jgi:hypothetical protein
VLALAAKKYVVPDHERARVLLNERCEGTSNLLHLMTRRARVILRDPQSDVVEVAPRGLVAMMKYSCRTRKWQRSNEGSPTPTGNLFHSTSWTNEYAISAHASPLSSGAIAWYMSSNKELGHDASDAGRSVA